MVGGNSNKGNYNFNNWDNLFNFRRELQSSSTSGEKSNQDQSTATVRDYAISKRFAELEEVKNYTEATLEKIKGELKIYKENSEVEFKKIRGEIDSYKSQISQSKDSSIQILSIYVALFTFISVTFQVLSQTTNFYHLLALLLLNGGLLLQFISIIYLFTKFIPYSSDESRFKWFRQPTTILMGLGLLLIGVSLYISYFNMKEINKFDLSIAKNFDLYSQSNADSDYHDFIYLGVEANFSNLKYSTLKVAELCNYNCSIRVFSKPNTELGSVEIANFDPTEKKYNFLYKIKVPLTE